MLRKDYILRQYEEFGKFLGIVFSLKTKAQFVELEELINTSAFKFTKIEIETAEQLSNENLVETLTKKHQLEEPNLKMLADLLYEKGIGYSKQFNEKKADSALQKALIIYEYIKENSLESDFSLDGHFKITSLKQLLNK